MIVELGHFALVLALAVALIQATVPLIGAHRRQTAWMAVADTYDSITSSRAYRPGRSHEVAMRELERVSGSQLDPSLVAVFKEIAAAEPEWLVRFNIRRDKD